MASIVTNAPALALDTKSGLFAALNRAIANWKLYRQTLDELRALNDRELADLGLTRFAIRDVAWNSVYAR
ncbi:MAG: DUF1127 domain-containing protein [Amaricoccus sp.]